MPSDPQAVVQLLGRQAAIRRAAAWRPSPWVDVGMLALATALLLAFARQGQAEAGLCLGLLLALLRSAWIQRAQQRRCDLLWQLLWHEQLERRFVEDMRVQVQAGGPGGTL